MLNQVQIIGRLGQDPELRQAGSTDVCNCSIATTAKWRNKQGEQQERTEWHNIVFWAKLAEIADRYLSKGALVFVQGELRTEKWQDKQGNDRYTTKIHAREMKMLGGKQEQRAPAQQAPVQQSQPEYDDDIPF